MTKFEKISHYSRFPCMVPFIGSYYESNEHAKLLIVGESHYLPEESNIHLKDDQWYSGGQHFLNETELGWVDTREVIRYGLESDFTDRGLKIYEELAQALNDVYLRVEEWSKKLQLIDHISYMNYFQRPAKTGESLSPTRLDLEIAKNVFSDVIQIIKPDMIVISSVLAAKSATSIVEALTIPYCITPHPASAWWNRKAKKYLNRNGYEVFIDFLSKNHWVNQ